MSDTLYVLAVAYDHVEDALADYEAINVAHKHVGSTHDFDANVIAKGADRSVEIVRRHDAGKSHGAETGVMWGLDEGDAGLVVVYSADMADRVNASITGARRTARATTTLSAAQLAEEMR